MTFAFRQPLGGEHNMPKRKKGTPTMTDLLRETLAEAESLNAIEKATGVKRQSMMKFLRSEQSLRLDIADILAAHFGIESRRVRCER